MMVNNCTNINKTN